MTEMEHPDQAELSLQAALDRMRAETPEMPESFRQGWRQAVREERENRTETVQEQKQLRKKVNPWRRGFSIAAAAALVLGGTLLGRDAARLNQMPQSTLLPKAAVQYSDALKMESTALTAEKETAYTLGEDAADAEEPALTTALPSAKITDSAAAREAPAEDAAEQTALAMTESAEEAWMKESEEDAAEELTAAEKAASTVKMEAMGAAAPAGELETFAAADAAAGEIPGEESRMEMTEAEQSGESAAEIRPMRIMGIILILLAAVLAALAYTFRNKKE